jgi:hypothetical protein
MTDADLKSEEAFTKWRIYEGEPKIIEINRAHRENIDEPALGLDSIEPILREAWEEGRKFGWTEPREERFHAEDANT